MAFTKGTAYIHIGTEKTGTTTIQEFLSQNRKELLNSNYLFPETPGKKNHTDLSLLTYDTKLGDLTLRKGIKSDIELIRFKKKFKKRFIDEISPYANLGYNIIVSNEHLSSRGGQDKNNIALFIEMFKNLGLKVKVLIYLRPQEEFVISTYSTRIKSGSSDKFDPNCYKKKRYDYWNILNAWTEAVEEKNICVGIFQKDKWVNRNLLDDFLSKLDIKSNVEHLEMQVAPLNISLDQDQLLFLRRFNEYVPEFIAGERNPHRGNILDLLSNIKSGRKFGIDYELVLKIREYFAQSNEMIRQKYLPQEKELFVFSTKGSSSQKNSSSSYNEFEMFSKIWIEQQRLIAKSEVD